MANLNQDLLPGEEVVLTGKMHWWIFVLPIVLILIGASFSSDASTFFYIIGGLILAHRVGIFLTSTYLITNKRIILTYGIIKKRTLDLQVSRADAIMIVKPFLGRILNYGTVISGTASGAQKFPYLSNPDGFRRTLNEQIDNFTYH